ncbi:hypothetical protein B4144_0195 [Bacillus atrophaeus]|nr:hypothetical protein B4144_0195 [Bacillus atrophaeus]
MVHFARSNIRFCYERMFFTVYLKYMNVMLVDHLNNIKIILTGSHEKYP